MLARQSIRTSTASSRLENLLHNALPLIVLLPHLVVALLYLHPRPRIEVFAPQQLRPVVFVSSFRRLSDHCACQTHTVTFLSAMSVLLCTATPLARFSTAATLLPPNSASSSHTSFFGCVALPHLVLESLCSQAIQKFAPRALFTDHAGSSIACDSPLVFYFELAFSCSNSCRDSLCAAFRRPPPLSLRCRRT